MVWEEGGEGGYVQNPQGVHHVFFTGDARPRAPPILEVSNMKLEENDACQVILFDSKNAALFYEPQDATAVRRSIAFDLYVNLHVPGFDDNVDAINEAACRTMTLGHLLTTTPIPGYNDRFHQLLFSPESIEAIFAKLAQLNIGPPPNTTPVATEDPNLKIKFQQWEAENIAKAATIFNAPLRLQGTYNNTLDFQDRLRARMLNDMRRSFLGLRFFPHKPRDGDKEPARIWIRDMGMTEIVLRVGQYFPIALPLHQPHLIPPHKLSLGGAAIYQNALELIANGYADADGLLYSVGTLAQALGDAFGAYKEIQHNPEPEINDNDLLIYQTRCLYLFWCADYVAGCMSRRVKSEFVKPKVAKAKKGAMGRDAHALLLNYVAWCLFVDELPPRPFHVRQPVDA
ncbi:uncharacterized protein EI97DRAFT_434346 [Westerdykella ornata]|uniref:Uncharacterized protein n=1 Tax=Westerdykella ornata TaxID=318751 RepID=A0A6A6JH31_WESOR|nr:uncharacterized protein EI97DRAFT_434346 [Westerdykella ornata]KAF2275514.1 hypothetical protein EI97DRAFT_434346 [Westerdykella ornata]